MSRLRIVKEYTSGPMAGIFETDTVELADNDAARRFVAAVNTNPAVNYKIIDHEWAIIGGANEIISNPTGGYVGPMRGGLPRR